MQNQEFQFIDHLDELRNRLIKTAIAFMVSLVGAFLFVEDLYHWLTRDIRATLSDIRP